MATTIVTKYGSDAPAASDIVRGELAVDTENGRLYTENSSGAVVEIGLNPEGNVDVTGTVTATSNSDTDYNASTATINSVLSLRNTTAGAANNVGISLATETNGEVYITAVTNSDNDAAGLHFATRDSGARADRLVIASDGNVGIGIANGTEKFTVVNSASGIVGRFTNNTNQTLDLGVISGSGAAGGVYYNSANSGYHAFQVGGSEVMRIAADGSLSTPTAGTSNLRLGVNAGDAIASGGDYNVLVGDEAGTGITSGDKNVALGYQALATETTGYLNTAMGAGALQTQNGAYYNVAVGHEAGNDITTGTNNTIIGALAGDALTTGTHNVAVGYNALSSDTEGKFSVAVGGGALEYQNFTSATNAYNTGIGWLAGTSVTTGIQNTFVGALAGDALTDGSFNTALGLATLSSDTRGSHSVAVGAGALNEQNFTSATDAYNTAVGRLAGQKVTTGTQNTIIGALAGSSMTTGTTNTFIGYNCAPSTVITGSSNIGMGAGALGALTSGTNNVAIGEDAGPSLTTGGNNLLLGHDAGRTGSPGGPVIADSNVVCLGDENIASAHCQVDWTISSDQRDKTDFTPLDLGLDFVKALQPVTYKWDKRSKYGDKYAEDYDLAAQTPDGTHKEDWLDVGFKAQEVEALEIAAGYNKDNNTNLTAKVSPDGKQYGLQYSKFVPILVKAIQELSAQNAALTARIEALES